VERGKGREIINGREKRGKGRMGNCSKRSMVKAPLKTLLHHTLQSIACFADIKCGKNAIHSKLPRAKQQQREQPKTYKLRVK